MNLYSQDINVQNFERVYDYFENQNPNRMLQKGIVALSALTYRPRLEYATGANEELQSLRESDTRFILTANHLTAFDQYPIGWLIGTQSPFKQLAGNTIIAAKPEYLQKTKYRWLCEPAGAIPVFRKKDLLRETGQEKLSPHQLNFHKQVVEKALGVFVSKIVNGYDLLIFPEGERNRNNQNEMKAAKEGIGHIAIGATQKGANVAVVPLGIWFGSEDNRRRNDWIKPKIFIGKPIKGPFEDLHVLMSATQNALEESSKRSVEISN